MSEHSGSVPESGLPFGGEVTVQNDLPQMCVYGASLKDQRGRLFKELKLIWKARKQEEEDAKQSGKTVTDKMLCAVLQDVYNEDGRQHVNAQRISQWATGTDPAALCPDHIISYMLHALKLVIVWSPSGFTIHEAGDQ